MTIRLPPPAGPKITLRFVLHEGIAGDVIAWREGVCMPFAPCHAECVMPDGLHHLGQFGESHDGQPAGMQVRRHGYDDGQIRTLPDGRLCDLWVDLPCTVEQSDAFYAAADASLGEPYDWDAIFGFAPIPIRMHERNHTFCSAKMFLLLRKCGWLRWPVTVPAHDIDPAMLLLMLSVLVEVPH